MLRGAMHSVHHSFRAVFGALLGLLISFGGYIMFFLGLCSSPGRVSVPRFVALVLFPFALVCYSNAHSFGLSKPIRFSFFFSILASFLYPHPAWSCLAISIVLSFIDSAPGACFCSIAFMWCLQGVIIGFVNR